MLPFGFDSLIGINAGENIRRLQRELNRVFEGGYAGEDAEYPYVNVTQKGDDITVTAELPGLNTAELDIAVQGKTLTIKGERKPEPLAETEKYIRKERAFGRFVRTLELPFLINGDKVEASYAMGVLKITLPRAEQDKPRKINIS